MVSEKQRQNELLTSRCRWVRRQLASFLGRCRQFECLSNGSLDMRVGGAAFNLVEQFSSSTAFSVNDIDSEVT